MKVEDIEIAEEGQFALIGKKAEDHSGEDFSHANEDLPRTKDQGRTLTPENCDIVGYVSDKEQGNAIARNGGFQRDGQTYFVIGWRDLEKEKPARNESKGPISKKDVA